MSDFDNIMEISPYSLAKEKKERLITERLVKLTELHNESCEKYRRILDSIKYDRKKVSSYQDIPFLPVRLFKELSLKSVSDEMIVKIMTSSGTSGQAVSKIYLDKITSANQQKAMVKIVSDFIGSDRLPMIILDCAAVIRNRQMFSARGAGILGFSIFGSRKIYAFDENMKLNVYIKWLIIAYIHNLSITICGTVFTQVMNFCTALLISSREWKKILLITESFSHPHSSSILFRFGLYGGK